jgi:hypothetical protein
LTDKPFIGLSGLFVGQVGILQSTVTDKILLDIDISYSARSSNAFMPNHESVSQQGIRDGKELIAIVNTQALVIVLEGLGLLSFSHITSF